MSSVCNSVAIQVLVSLFCGAYINVLFYSTQFMFGNVSCVVQYFH